MYIYFFCVSIKVSILSHINILLTLLKPSYLDIRSICSLDNCISFVNRFNGNDICVLHKRKSVLVFKASAILERISHCVSLLSFSYLDKVASRIPTFSASCFWVIPCLSLNSLSLCPNVSNLTPPFYQYYNKSGNSKSIITTLICLHYQ